MNFDWEALVKEARDGKPRGLQRALQEYDRLAEKKPQHIDDYPAPVAALFRDFSAIAQANGRSRRGRPSAATAQLKSVYREWLKALARDSYETRRELWEMAKWTGAREVIDGRSFPLPDGCPADLALDDVATDLGISKETARDMVFPGRRKKYTKSPRK